MPYILRVPAIVNPFSSDAPFAMTPFNKKARKDKVSRNFLVGKVGINKDFLSNH
jgi:hypothetical protein